MRRPRQDSITPCNAASPTRLPSSHTHTNSGSQGVKDTGNFPAFMRYGFRSSLKADYCVHNLGFRCAKDL